MSRDGRAITTAESLRKAFDDSFAHPHEESRPQEEDFIVIRVAEDSFAVRVSGIAGVFQEKTVVELPGSAPGLLGVAGFREVLVPIYDLRPLLGYPGKTASPSIAVVRATSPVGLAFERFEGYVRTVPQTGSAANAASSPGGAFSPVQALPGLRHPVLHLHAILTEIERRARDGSPKGALR